MSEDLHRSSPSEESANERQVGGNHYKHGGEEHWDRVARLGLDYWQAMITRYVERWKLKDGVKDLRKAAHFLQKYIELYEKGCTFNVSSNPHLASDWNPVKEVDTTIPFPPPLEQRVVQDGHGFGHVEEVEDVAK